MSNVIAIHGGTAEGTPIGEPVPEILAILEDLLIHARAGEVRAIGVAATIKNDDPQPDIFTAYHNEPRCYPDLFFAVSRLRWWLDKEFESM